MGTVDGATKDGGEVGKTQILWSFVETWAKDFGFHLNWEVKPLKDFEKNTATDMYTKWGEI